MTETDISKVLIEGEYATIMGVKYKRVEEPKPRMEYQESGTVDKVEYNGHTYLRIDYDNDGWFGGVWWKQIERHKSPMNIVTDDVTRNVLEGLWYGQVKKEEPTKPSLKEQALDVLEDLSNGIETADSWLLIQSALEQLHDPE